MMDFFPVTCSMGRSHGSSRMYEGDLSLCRKLKDDRTTMRIVSAPSSSRTSVSSTREILLEWQDVLSIVDNGDLHKFYRLPSVLETYLAHLKRIALEYDSARNYIMRQVLEWSEDDLLGAPAKAIRLEGCDHTGRCEDDEGWFEGDRTDCSVQKTPFPYAVAPEVTHFIVWSKRPLLHPCIVPKHFPKEVRLAAWRIIQTRGLSGFFPPTSSNPPNTIGHAYDDNDTDELQVRMALAESSRYLRTFIGSEWNEEEFDVAWFANPPSLQSLPTLAHWHCMVRKRE